MAQPASAASPAAMVVGVLSSSGRRRAGTMRLGA
jgi:hypothetical protein